MSTRRWEEATRLNDLADHLEADRDEMVEKGADGDLIDQRVVDMRDRADRLLSPPEGWVAFGTNVNTKHVMEFSSDVDESGLPMFERVVIEVSVPDEIPTEWLEEK